MEKGLTLPTDYRRTLMLPKLVRALLIQTSVLLVKGQQACVHPLPTILSSPRAEVFPAPR